MICEECQALYKEVDDQLRTSKAFDEIQRTDDALRCKAKNVESEAYYYAQVAEDRQSVYVGLYTPDRWLSESIEAELMHQGEDIEELLEEELVEQGVKERFGVEHFRDENKQYIFRSNIPLPQDVKLESEQMAEMIRRILLSYEACFSQLGDMSADEDAL